MGLTKCERLFDISVGYLVNPFLSWRKENFLTAATQWDVTGKIILFS